MSRTHKIIKMRDVIHRNREWIDAFNAGLPEDQSLRRRGFDIWAPRHGNKRRYMAFQKAYARGVRRKGRHGWKKILADE